MHTAAVMSTRRILTTLYAVVPVVFVVAWETMRVGSDE
jgi:hypothetical protein